jgi:hypothetical protein
MCVQKQAVTVAEMARMVGLSRARLYQLTGSVFPFPLYDVATRRPFYSAELQKMCLEVRRRNCGIDGKPVLFHRRGKEVTPSIQKPSKKKAISNGSQYRDLLDGLRSLGLTGITAAQVATALKELNISTIDQKGNGDLLKAVFLRLKQDVSSQ